VQKANYIKQTKSLFAKFESMVNDQLKHICVQIAQKRAEIDPMPKHKELLQYVFQ